MKKIKKFTIDRSKWGVGDNGGALCDRVTGLQCCLGFLARACGQKVSQIKGEFFPDAGTVPAPFVRNQSACNQAAIINDSNEIGEREREARLKKLFASEGIELVFKGRLPRKRNGNR